MCEKPRLWVSHTDHYVPPTPLWERQRRSDQPTADPALIGFFFFFHCALKGRKSFCGVKGEAFLPFPSLELIGCVTRWPNPSGLMRGRPGPERGRLSPPLRARERVWRPGEGRGPRGAGHHLPRIYYSPAHPLPAPQGCLFMDHICWLADASLSLSLECLKSPRSQESGAHSSGPASSLSSETCGSSKAPVALALSRPPPHPTPPRPHLRGLPPLPIPNFPPGHAGRSLLSLVPSA